MTLSRRSRRFGTLLLAAALPVLAADGLQVKTGLWETTIVTNMGGIVLPESAASKMTPAQRAQIEAMMGQRSAPRTITEKSCLTEEDLKKGAFRDVGNENKEHCKYTVVSQTPRRQEMTFQCNTAGQDGTGRMLLEAPDSTHVNGTMDVKSSAATVNMKITSRWVSASCAGADKD